MKKNYASFTLTDSDTDADSMHQRIRTDSEEISEFQHLRSEYYNTSPLVLDEWILLPNNLISASLAQIDLLKTCKNSYIYS